MRESLTREALADEFSSRAGKAELVGVEVENGLVDPMTGCSVPYHGAYGGEALLTAIMHELDGQAQFQDGYLVGVGLPNGATFTLETGGALEYASSPSATLVDTVSVARTDLLRVADIAQRTGIALLSGACIPFTPKSKIPWIPKSRVEVMRDYFGRLGEAGAYGDAVMGLTLSTQTSLDYVSCEDLLEKMRLHVLAAPIIAALFVNSPIAEGAYAGVMSRRMQYWQKFDPRRCGVLNFAVSKDVNIYDLIDWIGSLPMIYRAAGPDSHAAASGRTFSDLMRYGFEDGGWPTSADWDLHLCQLWPHVRIRRTIELRASDGLPWPYFSAAPAVWVGLTYDAEIRKKATGFLSDLTACQLERCIDDVIVKGITASVGPYLVQNVARELLGLARQGLNNRVIAGMDPPEVLDYLAPLEQVCESGETFADRCVSSWQGELQLSPEAYVSKYRIPV